MSDSYRLEEKLFADAVALPAAERAEFLRRACAGDGELQARVEALVREHEADGDFLESPPERELAEAARQANETVVPAEEAGSRVGRYRLLEVIGEGGCGVVYRAEQTEPVRREVALKIIKLGMDTKAVIARFEAERQALALMDHSNIARALDAGATDTGRPYFVMELVRGTKITDWCDEHRLAPEERLRLFMQVCSAVQHAHQKGVIHRDLKPSNILVTLQDGVPVPKVIDFGIAKATQGRLTDHTLFTAFDQFIGTPAYMSPEQAEFSAVDIDTRSDIYSLGVLLYELLTGRTPIDGGELRQAGVDEIRRRIREQETPRPSVRLRTLDAAKRTTAAAHRQIEPAKLVHLVSGDLDWIAMRCLEKDRARRYETVNGLARDIDRYLANEPVQARSPSRRYVLGKFVRRHRLALGAGGAIFVVLVAGVAATTTLFFREQAAREQAVAAQLEQSRLRELADANRKKSETEAIRSAHVAQFMREMLGEVSPQQAMGRDTALLRVVLDATADRIERELSNEPDVRADLGETLGSVYLGLGEFSRAEAMLRAGLSLRRQLDGNGSQKVAEALVNLGDALQAMANSKESESLYREALETEERRLGREHLGLVGVLNKLSQALTFQDRHEEAKAVLQRAIALQRKLLPADDPALAESLTNLGIVLRRAHEYGEAEAVLREALHLDPARRADLPRLPARDFVLWQLGTVLWMRGRPAEAEETFREALAIEKRTLNANHPQIGRTLNQLGNVLAQQGKIAEAEAAQREQVELFQRLVEREPSNFAFTVNLSEALTHFGDLLSRQGKYDAAETVLRETVAIRRRRLLGDRSGELAEALFMLGGVLLRQGKLGEAEGCYREALKLDATVPDWRAYYIVSGLTATLTKAAKPALIEPAWSEAIACADKAAVVPNDRDSGTFAAATLMAIVESGGSEMAEPAAREHLRRWERAAPADWRVSAFGSLLGGALAGQRRFAEAEPLLLAGCDGLLTHKDVVPPR